MASVLRTNKRQTLVFNRRMNKIEKNLKKRFERHQGDGGGKFYPVCGLDNERAKGRFSGIIFCNINRTNLSVG